MGATGGTTSDGAGRGKSALRLIINMLLDIILSQIRDKSHTTKEGVQDNGMSMRL